MVAHQVGQVAAQVVQAIQIKGSYQQLTRTILYLELVVDFDDAEIDGSIGCNDFDVVFDVILGQPVLYRLHHIVGNIYNDAALHADRIEPVDRGSGVDGNVLLAFSNLTAAANGADTAHRQRGNGVPGVLQLAGFRGINLQFAPLS